MVNKLTLCKKPNEVNIPFLVSFEQIFDTLNIVYIYCNQFNFIFFLYSYSVNNMLKFMKERHKKGIYLRLFFILQMFTLFEGGKNIKNLKLLSHFQNCKKNNDFDSTLWLYLIEILLNLIYIFRAYLYSIYIAYSRKLGILFVNCKSISNIFSFIEFFISAKSI